MKHVLRTLSVSFFLLLGLFSTTWAVDVFRFDFENTEAVTVDNAVGIPSFTSSGVNTPSYFAGCTGQARSHAGWETGDYYQFTVNTTGYVNLNFSYCSRSSNAAVNNFICRVSTDGVSWTTIVASYAPPASNTNYSGALPASCENAPVVYIQVYKMNNADITTRNIRIDNALLTGDASAPSIALTSPTNGSTLLSSYQSTITWAEIALPAGTVTIEYAEDGVTFNTIGSVATGVGSFNWRPNYYHTTWDGTTFQPTGVIRVSTGALSSSATSLILGMQPCNTNVTQVIAIQDYDNVPANNWGYTAGTSGGAVHGVSNVALNGGTVSGTTPVNHTSGGSNAYIGSDNDCQTGATGRGETSLTFDTKVITGFTNVQLELYLSALNMTDICGGGVGMDVDDYFRVDVSLNGGGFTTLFTQLGNGNLTFAHGANTNTATYPTTVTVNGGSTSGRYVLNIPDGNTSIAIRVRMACNRQEEQWALDDVVLRGDNTSGSLVFSRDCYLDALAAFGGNTYAGNIDVTVASATNEDTDVLVDCSGLTDNELILTGDLSLAAAGSDDQCIVHLPATHRLKVNGTVSLTGTEKNTFVASVPHRIAAEGGVAAQEGGLMQTVAGTDVFFPVGYYNDLNTSAVKAFAPAWVADAGTGGDFIVRSQLAGLETANQPADGIEYFDNPAVRHAYTAHTLWFISPKVAAGHNATLSLQWVSGIEGASFSCADLRIGHWINPTTTWGWELATADCGNNRAIASGFTSFSPFMVGTTDIPFPVEMLAFQAEWQGNDALLTWATAQERNNLGFTIQRSVNGSDFEDLGFVPGTEASNTPLHYSFTDYSPRGSQVFYYRLRQTDLDGTSVHTNVVELRREANTQTHLGIYPNPTAGGITLDVYGIDAEASTSIDVFGMDGRRVLQFNGNLATVATQAGASVVGLAPGVYTLRLTANGQVMQQAIVKQ